MRRRTKCLVIHVDAVVITRRGIAMAKLVDVTREMIITEHLVQNKVQVKFRLIASLMTKTDALVVCKQSKVALRLARLCGQLTVLANRGQLQSAIRRNASRYWIETKMTFSSETRIFRS